MDTKNFTGHLEKQARELAGRLQERNNGFSITDIIKQDIALTVEQIDTLRDLHEKQLKSLLQSECYIDTELLQMRRREYEWQYTPARAGPQFTDKDRLHQRLFGIDTERRRLTAFHEAKLQELQRRLLGLIQRHEQLNIHVLPGKNSHNIDYSRK